MLFQRQPRRLGSLGHDQGGFDIEVDLPNGDTVALQCKRVETFGPAEARKAIDYATRRANRAILVLSRVASPLTADVIRAAPGWELWDKDDISRLVRTELPVEQQIRLVDIYFKGQRLALLGLDEAGPWFTAEEFFVPFEGAGKPFTHSWGLVSRIDETERLISFLDAPDRILLLSAAGRDGQVQIAA